MKVCFMVLEMSAVRNRKEINTEPENLPPGQQPRRPRAIPPSPVLLRPSRVPSDRSKRFCCGQKTTVPHHINHHLNHHRHHSYYFLKHDTQTQQHHIMYTSRWPDASSSLRLHLNEIGCCLCEHQQRPSGGAQGIHDTLAPEVLGTVHERPSANLI